MRWITLSLLFVSATTAFAQCGPNGCVSKTSVRTWPATAQLHQTILPTWHTENQVQHAAHGSGFNLAPGEVLISVDGVPVSRESGPSEIRGSATRSNAGQHSTMSVPSTQKSMIVNRDPQAYAHALREAALIATRGEGYHRSGDGGHPLGVAPGCSFAGTGYSRDPNRPNHCYLGELPESRLVARAMVPGPNGTYFWSAHYR